MAQRIGLLLLTFLLLSCGEKTVVSIASCTTTQTDTGAIISCPDGTTSTLQHTHTETILPANPLCFKVKCNGSRNTRVEVNDCDVIE